LTVAVPVAAAPLVLAALRVKVSPLSMAASCSGVMEVRTSRVPLAFRATVEPAV